MSGLGDAHRSEARLASLVAAALVSLACIGEQPLVSHDRCRGDCVNGHGRETTFWGRLKYEGTWRNRRAEGRGTEVGGDGRYEGEFHDGARWGDGVLVLRDGTRFEGRWLSGRRHGPFLVTGASGVTERRHFYRDWEVRCVRGDCVSGDGRMEGPLPPYQAFFSWDGGFVDGLRNGPGPGSIPASRRQANGRTTGSGTSTRSCVPTAVGFTTKPMSPTTSAIAERRSGPTAGVSRASSNQTRRFRRAGS